MALDTITVEQFELYRTVERKEEELRNMSRHGRGNVLGIILGVPFSLALGYDCVQSIENGFYVQAGVYGVFSALCAVGGIGFGLNGIIQDYRTSKRLNSEIALLKSDPQYKALLEE